MSAVAAALAALTWNATGSVSPSSLKA